MDGLWRICLSLGPHQARLKRRGRIWQGLFETAQPLTRGCLVILLLRFRGLALDRHPPFHPVL